METPRSKVACPRSHGHGLAPKMLAIPGLQRARVAALLL